MTDPEAHDLHRLQDDGNPHHEEERPVQPSNVPVKPLFGHDHAMWADDARYLRVEDNPQQQAWADRYLALTNLATRKIAALRCVVEIADKARCAFDFANGLGYDSADPVQKAMADLMEALVALAMGGG